MHLHGQAAHRPTHRARLHGAQGYAMAAILVVIAVMAIVLTAALPVWKHEMQREKEAELIFRGLQYVRAIGLYVKRYGPGNFPPSVDVLVQQRFLRKKYKDPITGDDFQLLYMGSLQQQPGQPRQPGQPGAGPTPAQPQPQRPGMQLTAGGIMGVASKSKAESIRIYNGRTHYNEWQFLYAAMSGRPGGPGAIRPGGPGRTRPGGPTGPGNPMGPGSNRPGGPGPMGPQPMPPPRPPGG